MSTKISKIFFKELSNETVIELNKIFKEKINKIPEIEDSSEIISFILNSLVNFCGTEFYRLAMNSNIKNSQVIFETIKIQFFLYLSNAIDEAWEEIKKDSNNVK